MRRREVLRLALAAMLDVCTIEELGHGLSDVVETHIDGLVQPSAATTTASSSP